METISSNNKLCARHSMDTVRAEQERVMLLLEAAAAKL